MRQLEIEVYAMFANELTACELIAGWQHRVVCRHRINLKANLNERISAHWNVVAQRESYAGIRSNIAQRVFESLDACRADEVGAWPAIAGP